MKLKFKLYSFNAPDCESYLVSFNVCVNGKRKYEFEFEGSSSIPFYAENFYSAASYAKHLFRNRVFPQSVFEGGRDSKKEYDVSVLLPDLDVRDLW